MRAESLLRYAGFVLAVAALLIPFLGSPGLADLAFRTCTLAIIAISWNMMAGAGLISLGHSGFWGVGAYAAILAANKLGIPFLPSLLLGMLGGALYDAVVEGGLLAAQLKYWTSSATTLGADRHLPRTLKTVEWKGGI